MAENKGFSLALRQRVGTPAANRRSKKDGASPTDRTEVSAIARQCEHGRRKRKISALGRDRRAAQPQAFLRCRQQQGLRTDLGSFNNRVNPEPTWRTTAAGSPAL
ncbi:hypothetical protein ACIP1U_03615 [Cupriavidus sp. NPDC089707]|uniref:hypothetical protein n=1 Tax=Cupriavidus sp. NPDC089707 TaxID=3363963 RepID=UPI00382F4667